MPDADWQAIMRGCERWLSTQRPRSAAQMLHAAADALDPDAGPDGYGEGTIVSDLEARVADMLGMDDAVLMPSGTMAQQIALRLHCDRRASRTVAFHPTCHLELHEHAAHAHLHGLHAELIGDRDRLIELADLERLPAGTGALLLELPQREIGGRLPEWESLIAQTTWARQRGIALHLDGARLWEAAPFYGRSVADISGLFDTVYVSLYKGLGGLGGSVLTGPAALIDEARIWRRRHGGALYRMFVFASAALPGLESLAPRMGEFLAHARAIATALDPVAGVSVIPSVPQTALFHLHVDGEPDDVWQRVLTIARERRVWLTSRPAATVVPATSRIELHLGAPALEVSAQEAAELLGRLVAVGGERRRGRAGLEAGER